MAKESKWAMINPLKNPWASFFCAAGATAVLAGGAAVTTVLVESVVQKLDVQDILNVEYDWAVATKWFQFAVAKTTLAALEVNLFSGLFLLASLPKLFNKCCSDKISECSSYDPDSTYVPLLVAVVGTVSANAAGAFGIACLGSFKDLWETTPQSKPAHYMSYAAIFAAGTLVAGGVAAAICFAVQVCRLCSGKKKGREDGFLDVSSINGGGKVKVKLFVDERSALLGPDHASVSREDAKVDATFKYVSEGELKMPKSVVDNFESLQDEVQQAIFREDKEKGEGAEKKQTKEEKTAKLEKQANEFMNMKK